jgi:hypothetical protein
MLRLDWSPAGSECNTQRLFGHGQLISLKKNGLFSFFVVKSSKNVTELQSI